YTVGLVIFSIYLHALICCLFSYPTTSHIFTLSLHDALPICLPLVPRNGCGRPGRAPERFLPLDITSLLLHVIFKGKKRSGARPGDRKSGSARMPRPISYAVFCLKKKRYRPHMK